VNLGSLSPNMSTFVSLDVRTGKDVYQTECGRGDGKEKVVRITLTAPMTLGLSCTETGSQVFELSKQLNPLDTCNANVISCADPEVLSFGCGFGIPNLQPGVYNLIVDAFQAGTEGTVNLTLTGQPESTTGEICDNGIDDDADGAADCMDLKCVLEPACAKFACRPDELVGLVPLNGEATVKSLLTVMAVDDQHPACDSAPGGQDAVVNFQLPALADVTIDWAQLPPGDHVLAIYADGGPLLACDAGINVACFPTAGMRNGPHVFPRLPMGRYHLVVDATRPGSEGGIAIQISAVPSP
jgi:hypothetical protein